MFGRKKSFFEKLTGSVHMDEEESELPAERAMSIDGEWSDEQDEPEGELAVDVFQTPDAIVIKAVTAGVKQPELDVDITRESVTIRGSRKEGQVIQDEDYFFQELYWGTFSRTIVLPEEVDIEESEAFEEHGLLTIVLPKVDKNRQTKLKVKTK